MIQFIGSSHRLSRQRSRVQVSSSPPFFLVLTHNFQFTFAHGRTFVVVVFLRVKKETR
jgi:hypothetical protein